MTLNKNKMVREIGRRTRLKNRDVQMVLETLIDVWTENLVAGERIELENLFVLETQTIDRGESSGVLNSGKAPRVIRRVVVRASKRLRQSLRIGEVYTVISVYELVPRNSPHYDYFKVKRHVLNKK